MQVLPSSSRRRPRPLAYLPLVFGGFIGTALVAAGVMLGYLAFTTPLIREFMMPVRPAPTQMAIGAIAWAIALTAPAGCVLLGAVRLVSVMEWIMRRLPAKPAVSTLQGLLGPEFTAARDVHLPDGKIIPELVAGPHGVAIFERLPPVGATRHTTGRWEARMRDGRWLPMENPLDRATRDAESVRRWLADDDNDFMVKVHAAVIAPDTSLARTPTCAVITREQVPAYLASLPPQRSLTASRRERLVELVRTRV